MTSINKLTQNSSVNDSDLFVIWDSDNQRTRSVNSVTLQQYIDKSGVNNKAFVSGRIESGVLIMTTASGEDVTIGDVGGVNFDNLTPNTVPIVSNSGDALIDSGITETDTNIVVNKTLIVPQESILIGPAIKLSDKGGYLGVSNIAEDSRGFGVVSKTYETEAQRDLDFVDGVPRIDYQYLVPAKWVYQFPFEDVTSDDNLLSFEFEDSDDTFIRKLRLFSTSALTGVRVWIENILPSGDALVWENVSPENQAKGQGLTLSDTGFSELDTGFIKISTANIKFRFSIQAMTGEKLNIKGSVLDLGFGTGFYPKMYTYTQDSIKTELLDGIDTAHNRFGEFRDQIRFDSDSAVVRSAGTATDEILQPDFSVLVDSDRPDITETNGATPTIINSVTVKHQGTWGPVQVSFSDLRTKVVNLVDGDNTITLDGKPLVIEANEDYYIRFTGAVGTGSETQISLLGDASGEIYASINKSDLIVEDVGLSSKDVKSLDTNYDSSVLTTKITLNDDTELESSSTITVSGVDTNVDGNESAFILTGDHLSSSYDATTKTTTLIGEDPNPPATIVNFDVSQDNTILLDNTFAGKIANLIQSVQSQSLATITLSNTSVFATGDVIKIQASDTYLYHFFTVYYTEDSGQQLVVYPATNVTLIKTSSGWNVEEGGRFNRVAIRPGSASGTPIAGDDPTIDNVQVISVIQSQAAEIISDGNGNSALQFDFSKLDGTSIIDDSGTATDKTYSSSKIVDVVAESSPYKIYQSISDIESDFGPITITPLDGVNDDQIRSNNCVNVLDAIGNKAEANLVIGSDTSLAPITYCELMFRSHNTQRTSITAISKNSSDMWVFSASVGDAGSNTSSRWYQAYVLGKELDMQGQEIINANDISIDNSGTTSIYSTNYANQSINYFNDGDISIGAVSAVDIGINGVVKQSFVSDALDMKGTTVKNIADGVNDQDAVSKTQSEAFVSGEFEKASNALVEGNSSEVNLKDSTRSNGYGNPSEKINYLPMSDNTVVVPDTSYGNMWFIHEKTGTSNGYLMIHKDLLSSFVDSSTQKIPFFINSVQGALGMSNQIATDEASDSSARWNCTAGAIQSFDDANSLPPPHNYYDQQARKGEATQRSSALSATYSPGRTEIIGNSYLERAEIKNVDDDSVQVLPNPTGDWFVVRVTTGGGTFSVKKVFQWFPREYADFFYSAEDFSLALGLKVDNNAIRIGELERVSDTTPVEQDPDSNGVVETISLPAAINNRIDLDAGQTKTLNVGYQNNQVNLVAYDVIIKSMVTDTNDTNYGRNFEIKGAIVRSNGLISFIKSQAIGESLNLNISVAMIDEHIQVTLTGAPCKLSINTKAVVKR